MTTPGPPAGIAAVPVPGLPEVTAGTDLAEQVVRCCRAAGIALGDGDVVAVASKVVAKAEGRSRAATDRAEAVAAETVRVVAARTLPDGRTTHVAQSRSGPVLAAAGVDASDVPHGTVLLLPADPDASARALRARLRELTGAAPAVLVTDTSGRPWRQGVTDFALGAAGLACLDDVRGTADRFGRTLDVTVRAVGDEVAALADLVKGKAAGTPVAIVRGLTAHVTADDGPGAAPTVRTGPGDWFAHGHVEAVRAALGVAPGAVPAPPLDPGTEDEVARTARAVAVALAGDAPAGVHLTVTTGLPGTAAPGGGAPEGADPRVVARTHAPAGRFEAGLVVQRLLSALWAEDLTGHVSAVDTAAARTTHPVTDAAAPADTPPGAVPPGGTVPPESTVVAVVTVRRRPADPLPPGPRR